MKELRRLLTPTTALERAGYISISLIILLLLAARILMPILISPPQSNEAEDKRMAAAWETFKQSQSTEGLNNLASNGEADYEGNMNAPLFAFDPNTADSATLRSLGFSVSAAKGLINWRNKGKKFYKKEDLKPLYNLPEILYQRLEPYIVITNQPHFDKRYASSYELPPLPATLDLNTTDSATLVRLNGIGPTLAHKIISRRNSLGGFLRHDQLLEIYKFPDSTYAMLREKLVIRPEAARKFGLNTASLEELAAHPYIGEKTAQNIIMYRNGLKRFTSVQQLRQVPLMNEEKYRSIAPYFIAD